MCADDAAQMSETESADEALPPWHLDPPVLLQIRPSSSSLSLSSLLLSFVFFCPSLPLSRSPATSLYPSDAAAALKHAAYTLFALWGEALRPPPNPLPLL